MLPRKSNPFAEHLLCVRNLAGNLRIKISFILHHHEVGFCPHLESEMERESDLFKDTELVGSKSELRSVWLLSLDSDTPSRHMSLSNEVWKKKDRYFWSHNDVTLRPHCEPVLLTLEVTLPLL